MGMTIKITPEWILTEIPITHIVDGQGNVLVHTVINFDGSWIKLALQTLGIEYKQLAWEKTEDHFFAQFEFKINDIREECPVLYEKLDEMNYLNGRITNTQ
jgi:hypothetical protein